MRPEQDAAAHFDGLVRDPERVHAPRQPEADDERHDQQRHAGDRPPHEPLRDDAADRVVLPVAPPRLELDVDVVAEIGREEHEEHVDEPLAEVRDDEAEDGEQHEAAAEQRARRVQPVPLAVGEVRDPRGAHGCAHSPALRVSARATSSSRSRSASSIGRPGDRHGGGCRCGHELEVGEAERARHRAAGDVHELHAPVGHGHLALEHDAASEEQVVLPQAVADRPHAARLEYDADQRHDADHDGSPQRPPLLPERVGHEERADEDDHADERADHLDHDVLRGHAQPAGVDGRRRRRARTSAGERPQRARGRRLQRAPR